MSDFEEYLVHIDIDALVSNQEIQDKNVDINILGMEDRVVVQINNRLFEGDHTFSLGTEVFFTEDVDTPEVVFSKSSKLYKYFDSTNKVLKMTRISVNDKNSEASEENQATEHDAKKEQMIYEVRKTYKEALNMFLEPGRSPPRNIDENDDK